MHIFFTSAFKKMYKKLPKKIRKQADERTSLFLMQPLHPLLNNHQLTDPWKGCRSINVTGDFRIVYRERSENAVSFQAIGTHHQLYGS